MADPFEILGLEKGASQEDVRKAYTKLAKEWHPDKNTTDTTAKFQELSHAYFTLQDEFLANQNKETNPDSNDFVEVYINTTSVYIHVHEDMIDIWIHECEKMYPNAQKLDRGNNGIQLRVDHGMHDIAGSLSITIYRSTSALHIQGTSAFLWLEEGFPTLKTASEKNVNPQNWAKPKRRKSNRQRKQLKGSKSCPFCAEIDNSQMLRCKDCETWIHHECTRLPKESIQKKIFTTEEFRCPACTPLEVSKEPISLSTEPHFGSSQTESYKEHEKSATQDVDVIAQENKLHVGPKYAESKMVEPERKETLPETIIGTDHSNIDLKPSAEHNATTLDLLDGHSASHDIDCDTPSHTENKSAMNKVPIGDLKQKFLDKARAITPRKGNSPSKSEVWNKDQANHLALIETNLTKLLYEIKDHVNSEDNNTNLDSITKKVNCLQDSLNKKMKEVLDNQNLLSKKLDDMLIAHESTLKCVVDKVSNLANISHATITVSDATTQTTAEHLHRETQTDGYITAPRGTQCNLTKSAVGSKGNNIVRDNQQTEIEHAQGDTQVKVHGQVDGPQINPAADEAKSYPIERPPLDHMATETPLAGAPISKEGEKAEEPEHPSGGTHTPPVNLVKSTWSSSYDLLIVGNSNTRNLTTDMFYRKLNTHIVTLKNKSIIGATKFMNNIKISSKLVVFHVGVNELSKTSLNNMKTNLKELINTTKAVMNIEAKNIIITSVPHKDQSKILAVNTAFSEVCDRMGCKFTRLELQPHDFVDEVHLNENGIAIFTSAIKATSNKMLNVKSTIDGKPEHKDNTRYFSGAKDVFSNFYPSEIKAMGNIYPTAEHLFHYRRAIMQNNEELADALLQTKSPWEAKSIAKCLQKNKPIDKLIMTEVLMSKANQCQPFVEALEDSRHQQLVEDTKDPFWGKGPDGTGHNTLGKLLMELRDSIQQGDFKAAFDMNDFPPLTGIVKDKRLEKSSSPPHWPKSNRKMDIRSYEPEELPQTQQSYLGSDNLRSARQTGSIQQPQGHLKTPVELQNMNTHTHANNTAASSYPIDSETIQADDVPLLSQSGNIIPPQQGFRHFQQGHIPHPNFSPMQQMPSHNWGPIQPNRPGMGWNWIASPPVQHPFQTSPGAPNPWSMNWIYGPASQMAY